MEKKSQFKIHTKFQVIYKLVFGILFVFFLPLLTMKHLPLEVNLEVSNLPWLEDSRYILGTDILGRDVLTQFFWGGVLTVIVALPVRFITLGFALFLHLLQWRFRAFSFGNQILTTMFLSIPSALLALLFAASGNGNILSALLALVLSDWAWAFGSLETKIKGEKKQAFFTASAVLGGTKLHQWFFHMMPILRPWLFELFLSGFSSAILTLSLLSFMGLGVRPVFGIMDWGSQIAWFRGQMFDTPLPVFLPCLGIILSIVVIGKWRNR
jgi:peptide/nickel transport system permease protein